MKQSIGFLLFLGLSLPWLAESSNAWRIYKRNGHDYVSLNEVAAVYGLAGPIETGGKSLRLANSENTVEATVDSREMTINGVKSSLCFPIASLGKEPLIARLDIEETLEPGVSPERCPGVVPFTTVVLDAGHGGYDLGAVSRLGCEKDYTLDLVRRMKPYLVGLGLRVIMTRDADVFVPLEKRAAIANASGDAVFLSIHLNATDLNPKAAGLEVFTLTPFGAPSSADNTAFEPVNGPIPPGQAAVEASTILAGCVQNSLLGHVADYDRGIKRARYAVLRLTRVPSILIEGGFLTDRFESKLIANNAWRARLAHAIAMGVYNYKNLAELRRLPLKAADFRLLK